MDMKSDSAKLIEYWREGLIRIGGRRYGTPTFIMPHLRGTPVSFMHHKTGKTVRGYIGSERNPFGVYAVACGKDRSAEYVGFVHEADLTTSE